LKPASGRRNSKIGKGGLLEGKKKNGLQPTPQRNFLAKSRGGQKRVRGGIWAGRRRERLGVGWAGGLKEMQQSSMTGRRGHFEKGKNGTNGNGGEGEVGKDSRGKRGPRGGQRVMGWARRGGGT